MPSDKPVTIPVVLPTLTAPTPALHVPPVFVSITLLPRHTPPGPLILPGAGFTVTNAVVAQPVALLV